ncbi:hypothetical protein [Bradyrhizobium erythrophlei]|uniref:Uncharacterized protein n=1 Tax=Bradyrhizobium erythrophlei TaxID=1437360 RepID=A0A1M7T6Z7_9BRAD|nr:hypothetical protein [Bradyrhizobium erythrophlei]SHN66511.1 hypothetical protein SAMN05444170_0967 [Bradyrhizobium erythrophlei]
MTGDALTENDEALRRAAIAGYLDQDPAATRSWRAHQWMCQAASTEQIAAAVNAASAFLLEAKNDPEWLATRLDEHNRARAIVGMPAASLEEFEDVLWAFHIHFELLNSFANGIGH